MTSLLEPNQLPCLALDLLQAGRPFAVVMVIKADGHTPVKAGACAIIEADGALHGTVGGGAVEAEALRRARAALEAGTPECFDFELLGDDPAESLPICGGRMRLLIDPTAEKAKDAYAQAAAAIQARRRGALRIQLRRGGVIASVADYVPGEAAEPNADSLSPAGGEGQGEGASATQCGDYFRLPLVPRPLLLIVGGGHVSQAIAAQASLVGFDLTVLEDRPEFADPARFPAGTITRCGEVAQLVREFPVDRDTFIVIATHGHRQDAEALRACIRRPAAYIGMIGSRRKVPLLRQQFLASGWGTAGEFDRVYAPIGLDIGAVTVPEIAAAVVAQLVAVRRTGTAPRMGAGAGAGGPVSGGARTRLAR